MFDFQLAIQKHKELRCTELLFHVFLLMGDYPAYVFAIFIGRVDTHTIYEDGTVCSETSAHETQTPGNHPK